MKKILSILLVLISINCFAQFPNNPHQSSSNNNNIFDGAVTAAKGLIAAVFMDTTAANAVTYTKGVAAILIYTINDNAYWYRNSGATAWVKVAKYSDIPILTLSNGLTLTGTNGKLGGTLSDATTTVALGGNLLQFTGSGSSEFRVNAPNVNFLSGFQQLQLSGDTGLVRKRLSYVSTFNEADFTPKSLVDKIYVDGLIAAGIPINSLLAATGTNTIANTTFQQNWNWALNSTSGSGLKLNSTATNLSNVITNAPLKIEVGGVFNVGLTNDVGLIVNNTKTSTFGNNYGAVITASGAQNNYALRLVDGSEGNLKILQSDASGNANWVAPSTIATNNIYNSDGTLTGDRSVNLGGFDLEFTGGAGTSGVSFGNVLGFGVSAASGANFTLGALETQFTSPVTGTRSSQVILYNDSIKLTPSLGNFIIDSLNASSNASDSMMVWTRAAGSNRGKVGYRAIPSAGTPALPATQIAFGEDGTNLMTSSPNFLYIPTSAEFYVAGSLDVAPADDLFSIGDFGLHGLGDKIQINSATGLAYYDNTAHTGKFLINESTATNIVAGIEVVGQIYLTSTNDNNILTPGNTFLGDKLNSTFINISGSNEDDALYYRSATKHRFATGAVQMDNYGAGACTFDAAGNISSVSDERLKTSIKPYKTGLKELLLIKPIQYKWNSKSGMETEGTYAGFSAQNVKENIPFGTGENKDGYLSLQDRSLLAAAVNAIKELKEQNDKQQKEIDTLKKQIKKIQK